MRPGVVGESCEVVAQPMLQCKKQTVVACISSSIDRNRATEVLPIWARKCVNPSRIRVAGSRACPVCRQTKLAGNAISRDVDRRIQFMSEPLMRGLVSQVRRRNEPVVG